MQIGERKQRGISGFGKASGAEMRAGRGIRSLTSCSDAELDSSASRKT
tara:strand:+ start:23340 stop:23483 length:144 start_codon:yes stop_codon:yes gene_type:complete